MVGLDDLCVRFIVNLPKEELESVERICFQVEEAQWFYEDFIRPLDPHLPSLNLRQFCLRIFQHCPLLSGFSPYHHSTAFSEFLAYKTRVPVRGAIMLNEAMDEVVLVKGWKKNANWSFPRGKINKDEKDLHCAMREVYEETGFDLQGADLVTNEEDVKYIEVTMREQHMRLYVFRGIPMDTDFEPLTRKEISKIQWYKLSELPTLKKMKQQQQDGRCGVMVVNVNKFYMVAPFLGPLKKWISQQKRLDAINANSQNKASFIPEELTINQDENLISNVATNLPESADMNRLITQLRHSGQSAQTNNRIELYDSIKGMSETSMQLENPFNLSSTTVGSNHIVNRHTVAGDEKANAMLSLRGLGAAQPNYQKSDKSVELPQTSFEQISELPRMPPSLGNQSARRHQLPNSASPPVFPFSTSYVGSQHLQQPYLATGDTSHLPSDLPQTLHQQTESQTWTVPSKLYDLSPSTISHQSHNTVAPYQRTGFPHFDHGPQVSQRLPSLLPPANALHPPKLTSHSSALLDIFRSGAFSKSSTQTISSPARVVAQKSLLSAQKSPLQVTETQAPTQQVVGTHSAPDVALSTPSTPTSEKATVQVTQSRSHQQEALLSIFRKPSAPALPTPHTSIPSLAPPTTLVELSAQSTPVHSRISSEVSREVVTPPLLNGHIRIQKRPDTVRRASQGPLTATVTGPLNFPEFDKIFMRPEENENKVPNSAAEVHVDSPATIRVPMTILPRPLADATPVQDQPIKTTRFTGPSSKEQTRAIRRLQLSTGPKDPSPKSFHPQILRRPAQAEPTCTLPVDPASTLHSPAIANPPPATLYQGSPIPTKENCFLDQRSSQTQEQKTTLLSLFSKPGVIPSATPDAILPALTPDGVPMVGLVSEKPTRIKTSMPHRSNSILPSPLDIASSGTGSWNSVVGDGSGSAVLVPARGVATQKPSPVDKKFLLGFLNGVVREGTK